MLQGIRSHLTYANVVATAALFLAMGGGAYALTGVPDSNGVFHGCVSNKTRVLRVVNNAASCQKPRRHGKHRNPGEFAIAWNQQGRPGVNGVNGVNGTNGAPGTPGTARAYALVNPSLCTGTTTVVCTFSNSKGISSVTRVATGQYCIEAPGISATHEDPIVTTEFETTTNPESVPLALADSSQGGPGCGNGQGFRVITKRPSAFNTDATTNDVGFVVAIP